MASHPAAVPAVTVRLLTTHSIRMQPLTALLLFVFYLREQPAVPESVVSAAEGLSSLIQTSPAPSTPSKSFVSKRKRYARSFSLSLRDEHISWRPCNVDSRARLRTGKRQRLSKAATSHAAKCAGESELAALAWLFDAPHAHARSLGSRTRFGLYVPCTGSRRR
jgi:hypothetical protein